MSSQTEIPATWGSYADTSIGSNTYAWSNPSNAGSTNVSDFASFGGSSAGESYSLEGSDCGFAVSGTVDGFTQTFAREAGLAATQHHVVDLAVYLIVSGPGTTPTLSANNYAETSTDWPASIYSGVTYGTGTTDLWGSTWPTTTVNGSGFGQLIAGDLVTTSGSLTGNIYDASITVYYTVAATVGPMLGEMQEGPGAPQNFDRCVALPYYVYRKAVGLLLPEPKKLWTPGLA